MTTPGACPIASHRAPARPRLLLVLSAICGSSFLFIKLGVDELEPAVVVPGRTVVGTLVLFPLLRGRGGLGVLRGHTGLALILGGTALATGATRARG